MYSPLQSLKTLEHFGNQNAHTYEHFHFSECAASFFIYASQRPAEFHGNYFFLNPSAVFMLGKALSHDLQGNRTCTWRHFALILVKPLALGFTLHSMCMCAFIYVVGIRGIMWPSIHPCTTHWKPVMTQLWMLEPSW